MNTVIEKDKYSQIERDILLIDSMLKDLDSMVNRQDTLISDIGDNISTTLTTVSEAEEDLNEAKTYFDNTKTILYTSGTIVTGAVVIAFGFKPALLTGAVAGSCIVGYNVLNWMISKS